MLGLILVYLIGNYFYKLAGSHNRSQWGFALLGVAIYYSCTFLGAVAVGIGIELFSNIYIDDINGLLLGLSGVPCGVLAAWGFYKFLEKQFSKTISLIGEDILDENIV